MPELTARQAAERVAAILRRHGHAALLNGGCVRDLLLGIPPKDFDIATSAVPDEVIRLFRRSLLVGAKFGVVVVRLMGHQIEVATFRTDGRYVDGRRPESVAFGDALSDARRRDFTINGMFMDPESGEVLDYVGGRRDLEAKLIRAIGDPHERFREDRLRLLRAVRFAARLGFSIEESTLAAIRDEAPHLGEISVERIRMELELILGHSCREVGWRRLLETNLLDSLRNLLDWRGGDSPAVAKRLSALPAEIDWPAVLATLFYDQPPKEAAALCARLRCSNEVTGDVRWLRDRCVFFLADDAWEMADVKMLRADRRADALLAIMRAELLGRKMSPERADLLLTEVRSVGTDEAAPTPLLSGEDLLAMGIPQGPIYTTILDAVYRAQLNLEIATADDAKRMAKVLHTTPG